MITITPLFILYVIFFAAGIAVDLILSKINIDQLGKYGHKVPEPFKGYIDSDRLSKISDYTVDTEKFDILTSSVSSLCFLAVIVYGCLPWFNQWVEGLNVGFIVSGMIFFAVVALAHALFSFPFNYYKTFAIEQRYGFNTSTLKIWLVDILKGLVVGSIIGCILLLAVLALVERGGRHWWLWAWSVFFAFQLLLLVIYPTVIAPWFNKFVHIEDENLETKVKEIMKKGGLSVEGVFKMDAGKRSRHTNAYFTGLGKTKRIVLFDTLLASHSHEEILAILAHEIGHWKKRHVVKNVVIIGILSLFVFYLASILMRWRYLYVAFGFDHTVSYVGLFLFGAFWEAVSQFLGPIGNLISRRFEREADSFAAGLLKKTTDLISALKRMAGDNLSNLRPHPVYVWFYYSHPPLLERIEYLDRMK